MENRSEIVRELFELRVLLNRRNATANIKTSLAFEIRKIEEFEYFGCYLKGVNNPVFLKLSRRHEQGAWTPSLTTRFAFTEDFCAKFLNKNQSNVELLVRQLRSLGLF